MEHYIWNKRKKNTAAVSNVTMALTSEIANIFDVTTRTSLNLSDVSTSSFSFSPTSVVEEDGIGISQESTTTFFPTESSQLDPTLLPPERNLSVAYTVSESIVSLLAVFGNALVVYIFCKNRSLRRYRNYYIVALAIADFLVGLLGIPFAILASVGLPRNLYGCLFTVSILIVLCTVSILCLVAVSIDRYWATTNPFAYYRNMTTTTAVSIILFCWVGGAVIGFLPMFGWYNREGWERYPPEYCFFTDVMSYSYLVFLYFATIVFPALLMIGFYGYIYHVVLIKIRQKGTLAPQHLRRFSEQSRANSLSIENANNRSATQVLRIMVSEKRREAKAAKKLGIIVFFFMLCWMPLYTINCIQAFYPIHVPIEVLNFTIILSHSNSALNPFLYAYHLKEFRLAMKHALLTLCSKLSCGLVKMPEMEKEYPIGGPMSRSLTMPSLGHITTIPNNSTSTEGGGNVSIKFRKIAIGRGSANVNNDDDDRLSLRQHQISPTKNNFDTDAKLTATRGKLANTTVTTTAEGNDKSKSVVCLGNETSSNQIRHENSLQGHMSPSLSKKSNGTLSPPKNVHQNGKHHHHHKHQSIGNGNSGRNLNGPMFHNQFALAPSSSSPAHGLNEGENNNCSNRSGQESLVSIPEEIIEEKEALNCDHDIDIQAESSINKTMEDVVQKNVENGVSETESAYAVVLEVQVETTKRSTHDSLKNKKKDDSNHRLLLTNSNEEQKTFQSSSQETKTINPSSPNQKKQMLLRENHSKQLCS